MRVALRRKNMTREDKLFKRIRAGDHQALDELIEMYYPEILRFCAWHTTGKENAEDAAQETFLNTVKYMDKYVHRGMFKTFLYKVALNVCIDLSRKKKDEPDEAEIEGRIYIDNALENTESDIDFGNLIAFLPDKQRELVILRYSQDLTLREISKITGMNLRSVQSSLRSALKKLEERWKRQ